MYKPILTGNLQIVQRKFEIAYQYFNVDRVCLSVCVSVTDVTSLPQRVLWERDYKVYYNAYAGNESPNSGSGRPTWSSLSRHSHRYRRATKARQTTLEQGKTVLSTSQILTQATKVRLRYKRVDFLGTANHIVMTDMVIFIAPAIASVTGGLR